MQIGGGGQVGKRILTSIPVIKNFCRTLIQVLNAKQDFREKKMKDTQFSTQNLMSQLRTSHP